MKCQVCEAENDLKRCSGCYLVAYCCVDHQKQDWPGHKKSCSPIKVTEVEIEGGIKKRCAIATRDLRQGEIILEEDPLFHVPYPHCCRPLLPDRQCLACGLVIDMGEKQKKCSTCSFPICSKECEQLPVHKDNECAVFSSGDETDKLSSLVFEHHGGGEADCPVKQIVIIRIAQMKKNQPENWEEVKRLAGATLLEVASGEESEPESESNLLEKDYKMVQRLMKSKGFHHMDFNRGVFDNPNDEETTGFAKTASLYKIGSNLQHACFFNCVQSFLPSPFFKIRVRAAIPVKKGEILTISRLQHHAVGLKGTAFRRPVILRRYNFICDCKQCNDPTELGSYISGVTCKKCREQDEENEGNEKKENETEEKENLGYLLPVDCSPASFAAVMAGGEEPDWMCNQCKDVRPGKEIMDMIRELNETVDYHLSNRANIGEDTELFRVKFLQDFPKKVLHPQHFLVHGVIHKSMMLYKLMGESTKFIQGAKYHLKIDDHLCPGLSPHRAGMERHIAQELLSMLAEHRLDKSASPRKVEKLLKVLKECDEYQLKSIAYYKDHPAERDSETEYYDVKEHLMEERAEFKSIEKKIKLMYNIPY